MLDGGQWPQVHGEVNSEAVQHGRTEVGGDAQVRRVGIDGPGRLDREADPIEAVSLQGGCELGDPLVEGRRLIWVVQVDVATVPGFGKAGEHPGTALEDPRRLGVGEDPGEEALEDELATDLVDRPPQLRATAA